MSKLAQAYARRKMQGEVIVDNEDFLSGLQDDEITANNEDFLDGQSMKDDFNVDNEDFLSSNAAQRIVSEHIRKKRK